MSKTRWPRTSPRRWPGSACGSCWWPTDPRASRGSSTPCREESTNGSGDHTLAFPQLLELAHAGRLNGSLPRGLVKTSLNNLLVMPPGEDEDFSLDGLRPLLEALSAGGVDVTVIAGPSLLEDPNATILAWTSAVCSGPARPAS